MLEAPEVNSHGVLIKYIEAKEIERAERIRYEVYTASMVGNIYAMNLPEKYRKKFKGYYELFYHDREKEMSKISRPKRRYVSKEIAQMMSESKGV